MPMIDADGCLLNVSVEGRDGGPTLMLSNSLGSTMQMWEPQMKALTQLFRVIRYDRRGHGKSGVPPGPYSMERFGRDVLAILDDLNIAKAHWCGLSMGGMVGQWLGANAPDRFGKIVLANTTCYYPDPTRWNDRIKAVKQGGIAAVADAVLAGWLTADFREREPQIAANMKAMMLTTPVEGYIACCEALSTLDQRELLPKIKSPTLVIAGRHDMSTPVAAGEFIRSQIPGASLTILDAAHISNVEQASEYNTNEAGLYTVAFRPDGRAVAAGGLDGSVRLIGCLVPDQPVEPLAGPGDLEPALGEGGRRGASGRHHPHSDCERWLRAGRGVRRSPRRSPPRVRCRSLSRPCCRADTAPSPARSHRSRRRPEANPHRKWASSQRRQWRCKSTFARRRNQHDNTQRQSQ